MEQVMNVTSSLLISLLSLTFSIGAIADTGPIPFAPPVVDDVPIMPALRNALNPELGNDPQIRVAKPGENFSGVAERLEDGKYKIRTASEDIIVAPQDPDGRGKVNSI